MVLTIKAEKIEDLWNSINLPPILFGGSQLIFFAGCLLGSLTATYCHENTGS